MRYELQPGTFLFYYFFVLFWLNMGVHFLALFNKITCCSYSSSVLSKRAKEGNGLFFRSLKAFPFTPKLHCVALALRGA